MRHSVASLVAGLGVTSLLAACSAGSGAGGDGDGGAGSYGTTTGAHGGNGGAGTGGAGGGAGGGVGGDWGTTSSTTGAGGATSTTPPCSDGTIQCDGATKKVCDGNGGFKEVVDCPTGICAPNVGCAVCVPNTGSCNGDVGTHCKADGSGYVEEVCDALKGTTCNAASGACDGVCSLGQLGKSYIGCDYWPTITANVVSANFNFAVAVSNTTSSPATVTVTRGANTVTTATIAANDVAVIKLPWVNALKTSPSSAVVAEGAYRLRSTQPVTVYQFNPLEYTSGAPCNGWDVSACSYTNDASLLLPATAWTGTYYVATWSHWDQGYSALYAITASENGTTVNIAAPPGAPGNLVKGGIGGLANSGSGTITLNAGDVAQVMSATGELTGTLVSADKPIQVVGGHDCTQVPIGVTACDHLEESLFPYETLSNAYIVAAPLIPNGSAVPKVEVVRIVATKPNTTLVYDPPQSAPASIGQAGQFIELANTNADFGVTASEPIIVMQYMEGQDAGGGIGDPAMAIAVGKEQYRTSYLFHAPTNYSSSFANIICPTGANALLDGAPPAGGFTPIGATGFSVARMAISNAGNGNHTLTSDQGCGLSVYGYGQYTSYWYPGGSDLTRLHE
jgi:hypothetical protein